MKKSTPLVFLIAIIPSLFSQEMIDNPARPISRSAGRVIELEETLRIKETGDQFFFKFPHNLKISANGGIFVQDKDQLLQFDANGKYLRNLFKKGQGPGEIGYLANYILTPDTLILQSSNPNKILWLNGDGSLRREISLPKELTMSFLRLYEDGAYYFQKSSWPEIKGTEEIKHVPQDLIAFHETSGQLRTVASFPTKYFLVQGGGGRGMIAIDKFLIVPWQGALAVSHTQEYLVNAFELKTDRVVRTFRRKYRRIKSPKKVGEKRQPRIMLNDKTYSAPSQKFQDDIKNLLVHGDELWVMTSTVDKRKGILFDVFDREGRYIDNFYLRFPHGLPDPLFGSYQMELSGDCLYLIEKDENEISTVVKYKLR